jgi:hypothetical protein
MPAMNTEKVRENRLRRMLERRGYTLQKSRRRDPHAIDYGGYMIVEPNRNFVVAGGSPVPFSLDLDAIEQWLTDQARSRSEAGHTKR